MNKRNQKAMNKFNPEKFQNKDQEGSDWGL
jgi:hypothetical protein